MRIEYLYTEGDTQHVQPIDVRVNNQVIGTIKRVPNVSGFGYTFVSSKLGSSCLFVYNELSECQRALEKNYSGKNRFGLDTSYHKRELSMLIKTIDDRSPEDYKRYLMDLYKAV